MGNTCCCANQTNDLNNQIEGASTRKPELPENAFDEDDVTEVTANQQASM